LQNYPKAYPEKKKKRKSTGETTGERKGRAPHLPFANEGGGGLKKI